MRNNSNRMPLIDALKAIAALLVLTHHFSSYGPLAESARHHFPAVFDWLFAYGRIVRTQSLGAAKTYFFDLKENRHELGSLPKAWPNQIKRILESNHVRTTQ